MSFPKIDLPLFKATIPSTKKEIMIRPMKVSDEKILLIAKEGDDESEISLAVKQVVNNCLAVGDLDTNQLTLFDIEYLFLKIWSISEENKIKASYKDLDDEKVRDFEIDLDKVEVKTKKNEVSNVIEIGKDSGFTMKYPVAAIYEDQKYKELINKGDGLGLVDLLVAYSIKNYFEGDSVHSFEEEPKQKIIDFLNENVSTKVFKKMKEFVEDMPSLYHKLEYKDENGKKKTIEHRSLSDFFLF